MNNRTTGSWHDAEITKSGKLYDDLEQEYQRLGGKIIVDSVFPGQFPFISRSSKTNETDQANAREANFEMQFVNTRQPAEWDMRALQGSFPQLKSMFPYEERGTGGLCCGWSHLCTSSAP